MQYTLLPDTMRRKMHWISCNRVKKRNDKRSCCTQSKTGEYGALSYGKRHGCTRVNRGHGGCTTQMHRASMATTVAQSCVQTIPRVFSSPRVSFFPDVLPRSFHNRCFHRLTRNRRRITILSDHAILSIKLTRTALHALLFFLFFFLVSFRSSRIISIIL